MTRYCEVIIMSIQIIGLIFIIILVLAAAGSAL
nr:MAG TPA: hypothetical protein [Caudoviricetes sp.]